MPALPYLLARSADLFSSSRSFISPQCPTSILLMFPFLLSPLLLLLTNREAHSVSVSIPLQEPSNAQLLDPALLSLSIEQDRWTDWAGLDGPNTFLLSALDNLKQRTGETPWIRIGADSEDHTDFRADIQGAQDIFPAITTTVPYPEASNITVGNNFYDVVSHLPSGTHVIWGVNFGQNNITAAFLEAQAIKNAFDSPAVKASGVILEFVEIGNEADLYPNNGARSSSFNVSEYTTEWTKFAANVSVATGITQGSGVKFWGGAFANSGHTDTSFSPQGIFANGILTTPEGKLITAISQHHYSGSFCSGDGGLLQDLMTKATIRSNLTSFSSDIAAVRAQGLEYIFGETNSYACHGAPGVSNTAGAALWTLDYTLQGGNIGIKRVHYHEGIGYKYNLIQPVTLTRSTLDGTPLTTPLPPHVQPQYYAAIIVGEAIGTTGSSRISELSIDDDFVAGYAFYEGGNLKRAVLINSQAYLSSTTSSRESKNITLTFSGSGRSPSKITVKRLDIQHADDTSGLLWGGQSFETSTARPNGTASVQTVNVQSGFSLSETEAILLAFE